MPNACEKDKDEAFKYNLKVTHKSYSVIPIPFDNLIRSCFLNKKHNV